MDRRSRVVLLRTGNCGQLIQRIVASEPLLSDLQANGLASSAPRGAIPRTAPDTTVLTTTVTTIARPTTVATDPFWAYRAWSRIPPGPGSVGVRGSSPLSSTRKTRSDLGRSGFLGYWSGAAQDRLSYLWFIAAKNTAEAAVSLSSVTRPCTACVMRSVWPRQAATTSAPLREQRASARCWSAAACLA